MCVWLMLWVTLLLLLLRWARRMEDLAFGPPRCCRCLHTIDPNLESGCCSECGAERGAAGEAMVWYRRFRCERRKRLLMVIGLWVSAFAWLAFFKQLVAPFGVKPPAGESPYLAMLPTLIVTGTMYGTWRISQWAYLPKLIKPRREQ